MQNTVLILDFGSRYTQLIARRVRELDIYSEIHPYHKVPENLDSFKAIILSGSPASLHSDKAPGIDFNSIKGNLPVLGICYGAQLIASAFGGTVTNQAARSYTPEALSNITSDSDLFDGIPQYSTVWMSHGDSIEQLPSNATVIASSEATPHAAFKIDDEAIYGVQFLPEVHYSEHGRQLLKNFLTKIADVKPTWTPEAFVERTVKELKEQLGDDKVVLGLSGGVDSTVTATL